MMPNPLVSAIVHTCADAPKAAIEKACALLNAENMDASTALANLTGILSKESLVRLKRVLKGTETTARELALALTSTAAGIAAGRDSPDIQLVWTGPDTPKASPRDTLPQMLEMIGRAKTSILLVTFAAFKATAIMEALQAAALKGIELKIIVESADDSAGQLSHDAWKAFPKSFIESGYVWFWPIAKRPKNPKGKPGKLHAKCLVIDNREVLVSSANLTDDAMVRNIEVGIRCVNDGVALQLRAKFEEMSQSGHFIQLSTFA
jgi:phosphatidylserine/phosphatidylglycerophosphate/cardiolipin synthase-like enzyme